MSDIHIYVEREQTVQAITIAPTGARGAAGTNGTSGGSTSAWDYKAKTNATSGYPGNGYLLWNNATQLSATSIIVSHINTNDEDLELLLGFFVSGQKLFIQDRDDSAQNQVWQISGTPTVTGANTSTAYFTFPVTLVSSAGSAFTNNQQLLFGAISIATNSVTSATTSDGTANLVIANLSISDSDGAINLTGENAAIEVLGANAYVRATSLLITSADNTTTLTGTQTTARAIAFPDASGTVALTSDIPAALTLGTGVATALAINTGSAGAIVLNGGTATNMTLAGTLTINSTSVSFGAGAAAAMRTALDVAKTTIAVKTSDETRTSTTAAADSDLVVALEANSTYEIVLYHFSTITTGSMTAYVDYTGTLNASIAINDTIGTYHGTSSGRWTWAAISPPKSASYLSGSGLTPAAWLWTFTVPTLTAGAFRLMWSAGNGTGGASGTAIMKIGSRLIVTKLS